MEHALWSRIDATWAGKCFGTSQKATAKAVQAICGPLMRGLGLHGILMLTAEGLGS